MRRRFALDGLAHGTLPFDRLAAGRLGFDFYRTNRSAFHGSRRTVGVAPAVEGGARLSDPVLVVSLETGERWRGRGLSVAQHGFDRRRRPNRSPQFIVKDIKRSRLAAIHVEPPIADEETLVEQRPIRAEQRRHPIFMTDVERLPNEKAISV